MPPDPGAEHRLLVPGELVMLTDEFFCNQFHGWFPVVWPFYAFAVRYKHQEPGLFYRRTLAA